jgi:hypothetical protein
MSDYKVSTFSPDEAEAMLTHLRAGRVPPKRMNPKLVLAGDLELKGSFEITARDAESGEVAWTHADNNLITDFGRFAWMDMRFYYIQVGFCASTEAPDPRRSALIGDSTQIFSSGNLTPSNNSVTHTKTVSTTFGTPANNRTLGTIFVLRVNESLPYNMARGVLAYALLTPPKTQTTTQTLEVVYKISMSPIY